jgi:hypothetical protein
MLCKIVKCDQGRFLNVYDLFSSQDLKDNNIIVYDLFSLQDLKDNNIILRNQNDKKPLIRKF